ncbi:hypothetical protein L6164_034414 [Bauhinia variegata]|uniref:Uncharacterized protein n=1 Tax=Bauhinia variegata TaxID=167791 RepID=A0ACB9KVA0_BAUVA|nr:hypothetical protein L6164_034414 [Bauhinia variegata]
MSCIRLRFAPATKAWKSLTSKLGKLRKIRKSKAIRKPRKHVNSTVAKPAKPSKFLARRFRRKKLTVRSVIYGLHKKPAPVYVDKLFKEPACDLVQYVKPQMASSSGMEKTVSAR